MNILGRGFDQFVIDQINTRQHALGNVDNAISDDILTWAHAKTAWVRLASSVDISGSNLSAKNNVLFGGTAVYNPSTEENDESWGLTSGFLNNNIKLSSYDDTMFGYRPKPNITSVDVSYLNNGGTLKKASIKIKAYSPEQLEELDKLYLRIGYSVLLEWGHTIYLNNKGEKVEFSPFVTKPFNEFFRTTTSQNVYNAIKEEQKLHDGNYEAFYGVVLKFNWSFAEDGTYDILVVLITQGNVIESLTLNSCAGLQSSQLENAASNDGNNEDEKNKEDAPSVISTKDASFFNQFLWEISKSSPITFKYGNDPKLLAVGVGAQSTLGYDFGLLKKQLSYDFKIIDLSKIREKYKIQFNSDGFTYPFKTPVDSWWSGPYKNNEQGYIPLGIILSYLENNQNLFNNQKDPYVRFDIDESNYCLTFGQTPTDFYGHMSSDPRICMIPCFFTRVGNKNIPPDFNKFKVPNNDYVGNLMYIHYNINYLAGLVVGLKDEKGKVYLSKFLDTLLSDTNKCLGGINRLTYKILEDNTITIVDEVSLNYGSLKPEQNNYARFNVYGVRQGQGSFIKNMNFNVTITKDMATTVAIGAQANSNQIGQNSVSLSQLNKGLIDRTVTEKNTSSDVVNSSNSPNDLLFNTTLFGDAALQSQNTTPSVINNEKTISTKLAEIARSVYETDRNLDDTSFENFVNLNRDYCQYSIGTLSENKVIPSPFFLPFDLNLEMMGLGGIRLLENFSLTQESEKILPSIFRDNNGNSVIDFMVMDFNHKISDNNWTTQIRGITIPASPKNSSIVVPPNNNIVSEFTDACKKIKEGDKSALLKLIAKHEGGDYVTINGGGKVPDLVSLPIDTILNDLQPKMIGASKNNKILLWKNNKYTKVSSSAVGRYQFIKSTLQDTLNTTNYDPKVVKFTPAIQDELILKRLETTRQLDAFLNGRISVEQFGLNLAKEFASFPVLASTTGQKRVVARGETYYAGVEPNRALHSADEIQKFLEQLNPKAPLGNLTPLCRS